MEASLDSSEPFAEIDPWNHSYLRPDLVVDHHHHSLGGNGPLWGMRKAHRSLDVAGVSLDADPE